MTAENRNFHNGLGRTQPPNFVRPMIDANGGFDHPF